MDIFCFIFLISKSDTLKFEYTVKNFDRKGWKSDFTQGNKSIILKIQKNDSFFKCLSIKQVFIKWEKSFFCQKILLFLHEIVYQSLKQLNYDKKLQINFDLDW